MGDSEIKSSDEILRELNNQFMQSLEFMRLIEEAKQAGRDEITNQQIRRNCPLAAIEQCSCNNYSTKCCKCRTLADLIASIPEKDTLIMNIGHDLINKEVSEIQDALYDQIDDLSGEFDEMILDLFKYIQKSLEEKRKAKLLSEENLTQKELLILMATTLFIEKIDENELLIKQAMVKFHTSYDINIKRILEQDKKIVDVKPDEEVSTQEQKPDTQLTEQNKIE